jgi:drug/metabolite transporter (DMT)-like permease
MGMLKVILVLLAALLLEAIGVVFLSAGLKQIGAVPQVTFQEVLRFAGRALTNRSLLFGVLLEALFFGTLLYLLSSYDVSLIWPLTSLGFVLTALAAKFILHERVDGLRWAGVLLIVVGAAMVSWSGQNRSHMAVRVEGPASMPDPIGVEVRR